MQKFPEFHRFFFFGSSLKMNVFFSIIVFIFLKMQYTSLVGDGMPWMNLADSMRSQDNINKVVSQEREYNLLPMDRVADISVRR